MLKFPNGKTYVGQTIKKKVEDRWRAHKNRAASNTGNCRALTAAIRKYGWENVTKSVLEVAPNDALNERERYWIGHFMSDEDGYNLTAGGDENPMLHQATRDQLKKTLATPESFAKRSQVIKALHADPEKRAAWEKAHAAVHRTAERRAQLRTASEKGWNRVGEKERRGKAISKGLNTPEMLASKATRVRKMMETKAKQREELLAKLPLEERAKREKFLKRVRERRRTKPGSQ